MEQDTNGTAQRKAESMQSMEAHVQTQAARILECIQALDHQYSAWIAEHDPELARGLSGAAATLDQVIALTQPPGVTNS